MELCKTRTKKSSPDIFNFYVVSAGHGMVTDAGKKKNVQAQVQRPMITNKVQKMKDLPKTWVLTENQFKDFRRKKEQKQYSRPFREPNGKQRTLQVSIDHGPRKQ